MLFGIFTSIACSEEQSNKHAEAFLAAIQAAANIRTSPTALSFASVKLTALGDLHEWT